MRTRKYRESVVKELFAKSGNVCTFPGCNCTLYDGNDEEAEGHICHIVGLKPGSIRHNPNMTEEELNDYDNLILMCPKHHEEIDSDEKQYTVDVLKKMKKEHEAEIARKVAD